LPHKTQKVLSVSYTMCATGYHRLFKFSVHIQVEKQKREQKKILLTSEFEDFSTHWA